MPENPNTLNNALLRLTEGYQQKASHVANQGIGLFSRPKVQGLYYNGQTIVLDGYTFIGCRFDNCTLYIATSNFDILNCVLDQSTKISYGIEAAKIIKLFNSRYEWAAEVFPEFMPTKNGDGTITISSGVA